MLFSVDSDAIKEKLAKRTFYLKIVEYVGLFAILLESSLSMILSYPVFHVMLTAWMFIILFILGFSIFRIRKYSKMLVNNKIFVNECLMITHLISFAGLAIVYSSAIALYLLTDSDSEGQTKQ